MLVLWLTSLFVGHVLCQAQLSLRADSRKALSKRLVNINAVSGGAVNGQIGSGAGGANGTTGEQIRKRLCRDVPSVSPISGAKQSLLKVEQSAHAAKSACDSPEQLEAWKDSGLALQSRLTADQLLELGHSVDASSYGAELHTFIDHLHSRFVAQPGNLQAANFVKGKFEELGLKTSLDPLAEFPALKRYLKEGSRLDGKSHTATPNVVGQLEGTDLANEVIVLGAHFDSVNWEDLAGAAPGVDDNGSGVALVLEVAKVLAQAPVKLRRSVLFVVFNAEEEGLFGSQQFAKDAKAGHYGHVKAAVVADEVAYPGHAADAQNQAIFETVGTVQGATALLDTFAHCAAVNHGDGVSSFVVNKHGFGSDHISFTDQGIPAVLLIEKDNMYHADRWGHSARDTFKHVDFTYGAAMTRLALRAVATLASPVH